MNSALAKLIRQLNHEFTDPALLERALTHSSKSSDNNERLEFLGDSVLNFAISAALYERYPQISEGGLTRVRAGLVKKETLARLARQLELGEYLKLGVGEMKSGGFERDSILADALEAVFGAVFLDAGIDRARAVILGVYHDSLEKVTPATVAKDPKTQLQEYLQKRVLDTPTYNVIEVTGEAHRQSFRVECIVPGLARPVEGVGKNRRSAEQEAASRALELLAVDNSGA
ncbi:MAG: ribonuclease III [Acidiferrobacterales bacterium]